MKGMETLLSLHPPSALFLSDDSGTVGKRTVWQGSLCSQQILVSIRGKLFCDMAEPLLVLYVIYKEYSAT